VHILSLPDPAAARAFAFGEPNYQAGVYWDVLLRRWRNLLRRTMWDTGPRRRPRHPEPRPVRRHRRILAIVGGLLAGLGLGGIAAAIIEALGVNDGASTVPVVIAGLALGLGVGLIVAAVIRGPASG
jgi:hypothetical protein